MSTQLKSSLAAVFPGQGSQSVGMGKLFYEEFKEFRHTFEEGSDAIKVDLKRLCFEGPDQDLQLTENTQPAILAVSTGLWRVLKNQFGLQPVGMSGHSVGEYGALVAAEVLAFKEAMQAVKVRGQAMQAAVPVGQGAMAAVMGLDEDAISRVCATVVRDQGVGVLAPANFNAPGQIVVSGSAKAVQWLKENLTAQWLKEALSLEARPKVIPLAVSAPFHCELMKPAEERMRLVLQATEFKAPVTSVVQNTTAESYADPSAVREQLIRQISAPVRWIACQEKLVSMGATAFLEVGSGKVLSGLAKKTVNRDGFMTYGLNSIEDLKTLESALG